MRFRFRYVSPSNNIRYLVVDSKGVNLYDKTLMNYALANEFHDAALLSFRLEDLFAQAHQGNSDSVSEAMLDTIQGNAKYSEGWYVL